MNILQNNIAEGVAKELLFPDVLTAAEISGKCHVLTAAEILQNPDMNIIENLWRLINIDLRKIKNSIQSRPDLMNTLQQISR